MTIDPHVWFILSRAVEEVRGLRRWYPLLDGEGRRALTQHYDVLTIRTENVERGG